ncbi:sugar MFS transporter [Mucilaginibacter sp. FT3.2]|uniref:sugar MFS transporter n=1 Tax=Mucilaginibacter sp. FT3.2 TaxID=2723090 RepID=UPI001619D06D|nr:sugar MFS transporter [Mucilaginibacter sp. FT3.2]MBB6233931.1 FHS family L-fucose permease-like MFS transporter [Mucilaginibacter sp. FT3.2]
MEKKNSNLVPLITLTSLFFMWGFITSMNDILIPHLRSLFQLNYLESMLVQFCFFGAYFIGSVIYFIISYFKGDPINRIGYKNGILLGLLISAIGCFLFYPAAATSKYGIFLVALFTLGLGFTLLQIAANAYVSLLGSEESASSRLNLTQGFNSFGTTIAPVLGGYLILQFFAEKGTISASSTQIPYLIFGGIFLLLGAVIYKVQLPAFTSDDTETGGFGALKFPQLKRGIFGIFFYVGGEVAIGSFIIIFLKQANIADMPEAISKNFLALYWGGAMIGRFIGAISLSHGLAPAKKLVYMVITSVAVFLLIYSIVDVTFAEIYPYLIFMVLNLVGFILGKSAAARTLFLFALVNIVLLAIAIFFDGHVAMWSLIGIGIFNSIMYSNIYTLSIAGLGKYTGQGSSLLVMAILGGAVVPVVQGALADVLGLQKAMMLPLVCYLYIAYFGYYCWKNIDASLVDHKSAAPKH